MSLTDWLWGEATLPPFVKPALGECLVVGPARCVWDDLAKLDLTRFNLVIGVGFTGLCCPHVRFDMVASLHHERAHAMKLMYEYTHGRSALNLPPFHSNEDADGVDLAWGFQSIRGTSALFAVKIGMVSRESVVLAGIPFDQSGYVWWPEGYEGPSHQRYGNNERDRQLWKECAHISGGRVKSCSGWTADVFGKV